MIARSIAPRALESKPLGRILIHPKLQERHDRVGALLDKVLALSADEAAVVAAFVTTLVQERQTNG